MRSSIRTHDGTVIVTDPKRGLSVSGRSIDEAAREIDRLGSHPGAATPNPAAPGAPCREVAA